MIARSAAGVADLVGTLLPRYAPYVQRAPTSYRPQPAVGLAFRAGSPSLEAAAFCARLRRTSAWGGPVACPVLRPAMRRLRPLRAWPQACRAHFDESLTRHAGEPR
jgi:hypothetical protein